MVVEISRTDITTEQMIAFYVLVQDGYINKKVLGKFLKNGGKMANYPKFIDSKPISPGQLQSFWMRANKKQITKKNFQDFLDKVNLVKESSENKTI